MAAGTGRPTLSQVAAQAGVSLSTASLVFSGAGPVSAATREKVHRAAARIGYTGPDPLARSLRQGRSGIVGVLIGERLRYAFRDPVTVALLDGLTDELTPAGCAPLLLSGSGEHTGPPPDQVAKAPLDAAVVESCSSTDEPALASLHARGVPLVVVEGPRIPDAPTVQIDNYDASAALTRHLLALGHRDFGVVTLPASQPPGPGGWVDDQRRGRTELPTWSDRLRGVEDTLGHRVPTWETASGLVEEGERAGHALLDSPRRPTAIVAQSDLLAAGVVQAARTAGFTVPDDVSVAGFDGIDVPWLRPLELTTVQQPMTGKGREAGRMVVSLLSGTTPDPVRLTTTLRPGTTTGPPPP
ncbi:LacI family DNA-binding transcriptional regulator [Saccharopolyspora sp. HNM0983]|uniref:LacI family DNA-binding transcriptional regulator n=1 Tax=Saccharopolyspora montiporae TaxID=2781240 RepID=A0A929B5Y3_9PSEU|nr:LacI family DNA-binding transcriptional regulator [Saccharopolyspora sp. HNM0983]MBE9373774.1 LacI family DNA-binding transcriptional regulator [Saccharopolyspora sp. HNM0983]